VSSEIPPKATPRDTPVLTRWAPAAWPGAELPAVIDSARRRASRDAERQTDTAHLLHSLLESDPVARQALARAATGKAGAAPDGRAARVLAYLAQRAIGYGMRWRGVVEESGVTAAKATTLVKAPGLSPAARAGLADATARAASRGERTARGTDLLGALAADPTCRAAQVLRATGVDPKRLASAHGAGRLARIRRGGGPVAG
jgi:Clp amino terminal domain, pathogenicity island component